MATEEERFYIHIWTDGSCRNPGPGGYCALVVAKQAHINDALIRGLLPYAISRRGCKVEAKGQGMAVQVVRGGEPETTNNRMEMQAIIEGVRILTYPCSLTVHSDSKYAIGVLSGNFRANCNLDLVEEWARVSDGFNITWNHVNGHQGIPLNEAADEIAKEELHAQPDTTS